MYIFVTVLRSVTSFWQVMHLDLNLDIRPSMKQVSLGSYVDMSFLSSYFLCVMESGKIYCHAYVLFLPIYTQK